MKNTGIIFDHDGTLVNSIGAVAAMTNKTLIEFGFPECNLEQLKHGMVYPTVERFMFHSGEKQRNKSEQMANLFYELLENEGIKLMTLYPGVMESLSKLVSNGVAVGMVSNNKGQLIRKAAAYLNYNQYLTVIIGEEDTKKTKPAPDGLLQACAGLGLPPEDCWYIGDAVCDMEAAQAAGLKSGLVTWGTHSVEEITKLNPDMIIRSMKDLLINL
ncbi:MAG: HAD family hydrolase [Spirochaetales bacterium]|nr:HAD family hydrolase [Spirochaetales bacterium]